MTLNSDSLLSRAYSLHQAGHITEAIPMYQQLHTEFPDNSEILTLLGTAYLQLNNLSDGVKILEHSLELSPNQPVALSNVGNALHKLKRFEESIVFCNRAIALSPDFSAAYHNRADSLIILKQFDAALESCDRAIALNSEFADAYCTRGTALSELKRFEEALLSYEKAIALKPDFVDAYYNRILVFGELKRFEEIFLDCNKIIELRPYFANAYYMRGNVFKEFKHFDKALEDFNRAISLNPAFAEAYSAKGVLLNECKHFEEALICCDRAIAIKPDSAEAYSNRGVVLNELKRFEDSLYSCTRAIELKPDYVGAYCNQGAALKELKRFEEAIASCDRAMFVDPNFYPVYWNKAFIKLTLGDFENGWRLYEWRWKTFLKNWVRTFDQPLWLGDESLAGKTILIYSEQGLGDVIQASRYVRLLNSLGAKVVLEVPASLVSVMQTLKGNINVVKSDTNLPDFDFQCPIMSLPLAFQTTINNIPAEVPYLFSDKEKKKKWKKSLGKKAKKRIGIVCSGSTTHDDDRKRSIPLKFMRSLLNLPFEFHILQKEIRPEDMAVLQSLSHVRIHSESLIDFSDTAALVDEMDLVISVDTSVLHLAGALGKTVWAMIPWVPDFRWLLDRSDSPWYPTMKLFRQPELGNWLSVIEDICKELGENIQEVFDQHAFFNHALSLQESGRVAESVALYRELLVKFPDEPQLLNVLGAAYLQLDNIEDGVSILEKSLSINPDQVMVLSNIGFAFHKLTRFDEAVRYCDRAIELDPNLAAAYNNRANSLKQLGRFEESIVSANSAISLQPNLADAYNTRGTLYSEFKQFDKALENFDYAISLQPNFTDALNNRGVALYELKRLNEALISYDTAIALRPDFAEAYCNRGSVLKELRKLDAAVQSYNRAITLRSNFADAYCNRSIALSEMKYFNEARDDCNRAISLKPDFAHAYWNKSLINLISGNYEEGWALYEWRWRSIFKDKVRTFDQPLWLGGEPISGKTVLIYEEQGLGDVIQMCRYVSLLNSSGANVILEVPESLVSVMSTLKGKVSVIKRGDKLAGFDFQCPIMSLPLAFKTTVENIPANTPYLSIDKIKQKLWKAILGKKVKPRIGLVCSGSIIHKNDNKRSLALELFGKLFDLPFEFHILQKEIRSKDAAVLHGLPHVRIYNEMLTDFSDTAAVINEMDLIISVDTSVAHLAGALNKPVWILLSYLPDFRWLLDRSDSPWYPTARLFRQSQLDDWDGVVNDIYQKLQSEYGQ